MPTSAEKKALLFFALIAALGAGMRVVQAVRGNASELAPPDSLDDANLDTQIAAADSAHTTDAGRRHRGKSSLSAKGHRQPHSYEGSPPPVSAVPPVQQAVSSREQAAPVDLDTASEPEIETLPFIGPALAKRIVADREAKGPFGSLDGLIRVRGIGPAMANKLKDKVSFSGRIRRQ